MDRRNAAQLAAEIADWARTQEARAVTAGQVGDARVWRDLTEAADDLGHMVRFLDTHLAPDG